MIPHSASVYYSITVIVILDSTIQLYITTAIVTIITATIQQQYFFFGLGHRTIERVQTIIYLPCICLALILSPAPDTFLKSPP